jgi:chloramphenicol-sensitive protein RarD
VNPQKLGAGIVFALVAYLLWGLLPAYFLLLTPAGAVEIVAMRVLLALVFCVILLAVTRGWGRIAAIARRPRTLLMMGLAAVFIAANWLGYVYASTNGLIVEGALGYFINPIVVVLLGVIVLRERLRPLQWIAIGVSVAAVVVLAVGYGSVPWIALLLAFSFGLYGLVKKLVGGTVDAVSGLTLETAWLAVPAALALAVIGGTSGLVTGSAGGGQLAAMLCAGVVTAVPLLLFASAARRLPLVYLGLTQYLAPILQFVVGVALLHEEMPPARWVGFGIVWVALVILTVDSVLAGRRTPRPIAEPV